MASPVLYGLTVVWLAVAYGVAADWRGLRSRRPYAYPLVAVGGVLYVLREWTAALGALPASGEVALAAGSNLAFLAALVALAWRWWRLRENAE